MICVSPTVTTNYNRTPKVKNKELKCAEGRSLNHKGRLKERQKQRTIKAGKPVMK